MSVDGADFNNPFFGEQRGGQRPAFTFNLDAVQEVVVTNSGASAEFGRPAGGFVNVITKSGTNRLTGTVHYFGKNGALSGDLKGNGTTLTPDFAQNQFGFTLGGPIIKDRLFFFTAYDQQVYSETKQTNRPASAALNSLTTFLNTAFGGELRNDFRPVDRTNNGQVFLAKLDYRVNETNNFSLKYNFTNSRQVNGTFDVDQWAVSSNAVERGFSNALSGQLTSQMSNSVANGFRFPFAREDRPRDYTGPNIQRHGRVRARSDIGDLRVSELRLCEGGSSDALRESQRCGLRQRHHGRPVLERATGRERHQDTHHGREHRTQRVQRCHVRPRTTQCSELSVRSELHSRLRQVG